VCRRVNRHIEMIDRQTDGRMDGRIL